MYVTGEALIIEKMSAVMVRSHVERDVKTNVVAKK